jgi:hypothetical protein
MKSLILLSLPLMGALMAPGGTPAFAQSVEAPDGFVALFNGRDLEGWHGRGHLDPRRIWELDEEQQAARRAAEQEKFEQHWRVENGELINDGHGPYASTDKEYGDIELLLEYKTVAKADSGVYLRGSPQVQIWDTTEEGGKWRHGADKGSGGLWNNSPGAPGKDPLVLADRPFGEWNSLRVLQVGDRTTVYLNDQRVVDHAVMENFWDRSQPLWARGPIQLQTHGGEIRWRNVFLREISAAEANEILRSKSDAEGFASIFNGVDLTGWQGAVENHEVIGGALVCKEGKGGNIFTEEEYGDFVVRLEFRLPPGGNNGLAIRYPGSGNPAYDGMCELQVLDDTAEKYARLDPRQFHGSVYGMVAPHQGFLRPVGEWNYQEVAVIGSTIKVVLNGTTILDADVSQVTEFMGKNAYEGRHRTSGYFGFAGHRDPVAFRNIEIKRLD